MNQSQKNAQEIALLKKDLTTTRRELRLEVQYIAKDVAEIKTNHLVHLAQDFADFKKYVYSMRDEIVNKLNSLDKVDNSRAWLSRIGEKIFDAIIIGVILAGLYLIIPKP